MDVVIPEVHAARGGKRDTKILFWTQTNSFSTALSPRNIGLPDMIGSIPLFVMRTCSKDQMLHGTPWRNFAGFSLDSLFFGKD